MKFGQVSRLGNRDRRLGMSAHRMPRQSHRLPYVFLIRTNSPWRAHTPIRRSVSPGVPEFGRKLGRGDKRSYLIDAELVKAVYCEICGFQRLDGICCRYRYDFHSTAMRRFNTDKSIFEDHAMTWINPDLLRGGQKHFGIRLAVGNVLGSDDGREPILKAKHGQAGVDVEPMSRRPNGATNSMLPQLSKPFDDAR
jgi:hypothetical protein